MPTPQKRTAVVTEAVRSFSRPFFCLSPPSFFVHKAERVCSNRDAGSTTTRAREGAMDASPVVFRGRRRFEFDFGRRALALHRRVDGFARKTRRAEGHEEKSVRRERLQVFFFFFFFKEARKPPLFLLKTKKDNKTQKRLTLSLSLSLSLSLPGFLPRTNERNTTEKGNGKSKS